MYMKPSRIVGGVLFHCQNLVNFHAMTLLCCTVFLSHFFSSPPPLCNSSYLSKVLCLCQCSKTLQLFCTRSDQAKRGVTPPLGAHNPIEVKLRHGLQLPIVCMLSISVSLMCSKCTSQIYVNSGWSNYVQNFMYFHVTYNAPMYDKLNIFCYFVFC